MAATFAAHNRTDAELRTALANLRPDGLAAELVREELAARAQEDFLDDGSDAYVRHLEFAGYDAARHQEEMEAQMGIGAW